MGEYYIQYIDLSVIQNNNIDYTFTSAGTGELDGLSPPETVSSAREAPVTSMEGWAFVSFSCSMSLAFSSSASWKTNNDKFAH